jgi:membrane protease YdiL (CAAX protease family)
VNQWRRIDDEYRSEATFDHKVIIVMLTICTAMILPRYFGRAQFIGSFEPAREAFNSWPYPALYPRLYWALFKTINYFLLPALVIKLIFKEKIVDYGLRRKTASKVLFLYLAMFLSVLPLVYLVSFDPKFLNLYPKYEHAGRSLPELLTWELAYGYQFFMLEFFFRGFILFALARYFGHVAIFIMVIPYTMIHFGKALPETLGSVIAGVALGTLALRTRSIYGGVLIHCAVAWSMDLLALWQKGALQAW